MSRCPVCESARIVVVLNERSRGSCAKCGARWSQEGSEQRNILRSEPVRFVPDPRT
jgi:transposase-like protein